MLYRAFSRLVSGLAAIAIHGVLLSFELPRTIHTTSIEHTRSLPLIARLIFENQTSEHALQPAFSNLEMQGAPDRLWLRPPKFPDIASVASDSFEEARKIASAEERAEVERLQKLYVGQINARLARLLEDSSRSHDRITAKCVLNVIQDERGNVLDVTTEECEADVERHGELERAIRGASPLPLPPEGLAMGSYLSLDLSWH